MRCEMPRVKEDLRLRNLKEYIQRYSQTLGVKEESNLERLCENKLPG